MIHPNHGLLLQQINRENFIIGCTVGLKEGEGGHDRRSIKQWKTKSKIVADTLMTFAGEFLPKKYKDRVAIMLFKFVCTKLRGDKHLNPPPPPKKKKNYEIAGNRPNGQQKPGKVCMFSLFYSQIETFHFIARFCLSLF